MQKIDVIKNGQLWLLDQRSDSQAVWNRVQIAAQTAKTIEIRQHVGVPPTPGPVFDDAQRIIFFANYTEYAVENALKSNPTWEFAITADPAYNDDPEERTLRDKLIAGLRSQSRAPRPWCDCRPLGEGTPYKTALAMSENLHLPPPIGQAETVAEYKHAVANGAHIIIGNPSQLATEPSVLADAIAKASAHEISFIGEVLHPDAGYSALGIPIRSACYYVGLDGDVYQPTQRFLDVMPDGLDFTRCLYHAAALKDPDWALTR